MTSVMKSNHINISFQGTEIARGCGVGQVETGLTAPLVHVQDQLGGGVKNSQFQLWFKGGISKINWEGAETDERGFFDFG